MPGVGQQRHRAADETSRHFSHDEDQVQRDGDSESPARLAWGRCRMVMMTMGVTMVMTMMMRSAHTRCNRTDTVASSSDDVTSHVKEIGQRDRLGRPNRDIFAAVHNYTLFQ